jgi:hypothetical protein
MHGDVAGAFREHPTGPILAALLAAVAVAVVISAARRARPITRRRGVIRAIEVIAVCSVIIGIIHPIAWPR